MNGNGLKIWLLILLILFPSIFPIAKGNNKTRDDEYILFSHYYIVIGKLHREENFSTPTDCKKVILDVKVGPIFTGVVGVYIKSEGKETHHTIFGTPFYIFGIPITFGGYWYTGYRFSPGNQIMSIDVPVGFGIFYVEVKGES